MQKISKVYCGPLEGIGVLLELLSYIVQYVA